MCLILPQPSSPSTPLHLSMLKPTTLLLLHSTLLPSRPRLNQSLARIPSRQSPSQQSLLTHPSSPHLTKPSIRLLTTQISVLSPTFHCQLSLPQLPMTRLLQTLSRPWPFLTRRHGRPLFRTIALLVIQHPSPGLTVRSRDETVLWSVCRTTYNRDPTGYLYAP
ncbi:hypothetical protein BGW80DRAFT_1343742 [Lactifluus volemus]|nr:hypothetical protein BGW80DRAFT_1343742 [Lactifluus volemus]